MKKIALLVSACLLSAAQTFAADVYVKAGATGNGSSWTNATSDLGAALQAASSGTVIRVAAGSYSPTSDFGGSTSAASREFRFKLSSGVKLIGGYPSDVTDGTTLPNPQVNPTILEGKLNATDTVYTLAFALMGSEMIEVDGFVFQNANANNGDYKGDFGGGAGGIIIENGSTPGISSPVGVGLTIKNCTFKNLTALWGGVIKAKKAEGATGNPQLNISNCEFIDNLSNQSGGGINASAYDVTITDATFANTKSTRKSGNNGGCVALWEGKLKITGSSFDGSDCGSNGGAVFAENNCPEVTIDDCSFTNNFGWAGGAINYTNWNGKIVLKDSYFENNSCGDAGGSIRFNCSFEVDGCEFIANKGANHGGIWGDGPSAIIKNSIFADNGGNGHGSAFKIQVKTFEVANCQISGHGGSSAIAFGWESAGTVDNVSVFNNKTTAIAFQNATATLNNITISGNSSTTSGAIINGSFEGNSTLTFRNATIVNNTSASGAKPMYVSGGTAAVSFNNTIYSNNDDTDYSSVFTMFENPFCAWEGELYSDGIFPEVITPLTVGETLQELTAINGQHVHELIGNNNPAVGTGNVEFAGTLDQVGRTRATAPSMGAVEPFSTSIEMNKEDSKKLTIYPTVSNGQVTILSPYSGTSALSLFSLEGALIEQLPIQEGTSVVSLPASTGSYIVKLQNGKDSRQSIIFIKK